MKCEYSFINLYYFHYYLLLLVELVHLNDSVPTELLTSDLHNPAHELNSNVELIFNIFEDTDCPITIAVDIYERRLNVLSEAQA